MQYDKTSKESILQYALNLKGKKFGELDKFNRLKNKKNKGADIYKICSTPLLNISIFYNFSILPIIELSSIFH